MTGPSRRRARRGLPHIANARNGVVGLAERVIEGHLAADLAVNFFLAILKALPEGVLYGTMT